MGKGKGSAEARWQARLERVWTEVVARHASMAGFSGATDLLFGRDHLVGSYVVGTLDGKALVRRFIVRVSYKPMDGNALTAPQLIPAPFDEKDEKGLTMRAEIIAANDVSLMLAAGSAHDLLVSGLKDDEARIDRLMAVQLLHELYHARLLIESDQFWPQQSREILPFFNAWAKPVWTKAFEGERDKLAKSIGLKKLNKLLNEKFAIELAFDRYGIGVPNAQVVDKYLKDEKEVKSSLAKGDMIALLSKLDQAHASQNVQMWPMPQPAPGRPASPHGAPQPRRAPVLTPRPPMSPFPRTGPPVLPRYRPSPIIRPWRPPPAPIKPYTPPQIPAYKRFPAPPSPSPRPFGFDTFGSPSSVRGIMGGRIGPLMPPPPPMSRYEPLPRGGRGWDPNNYAFSNLDRQRWRPTGPSYHYEPHTRSWD